MHLCLFIHGDIRQHPSLALFLFSFFFSLFSLSLSLSLSPSLLPSAPAAVSAASLSQRTSGRSIRPPDATAGHRWPPLATAGHRWPPRAVPAEFSDSQKPLRRIRRRRSAASATVAADKPPCQGRRGVTDGRRQELNVGGPRAGNLRLVALVNPRRYG